MKSGTRISATLVATAVFTTILALPALAQTYTYKAINVPNAKTTIADGINSSNVIVGTYVDSSNHTFGFRLQNGVYTKINVPNSTMTFANGIADNGDIVGTYSLPGTSTQPANSYGFLLHAGVYHKIQCPGSLFTGAGGINKYGTIVGGCQNSQGNVGYILKNGTFRFINAPTTGNPDTQLNGVSNTGEVAGQVFSGDNNRGFYIPGATTGGTDLDFLEPLFSIDNFANGVNSRGDVVGCNNASKSFIAFNPESGESSEGSSEKFPALHNFAPFGANNSCALSINYNRDIVGWYYDSNFVQHGYLAIP
jgi:uncharacterized membrane protein